MLGKPKFKVNDKVNFTLLVEGKEYLLTGDVFIVDSFGTFGDDSDVCYDIMVNEFPLTGNERCLVKHVNEKNVKPA